MDIASISVIPTTALPLAVAAALLFHRRSRRLQARLERVLLRRRTIAARLRAVRASDADAANRYWYRVRQSSAPILVTTPAGEILAASDPLVNLLGYDSEADLCKCRAQDCYADPIDRQTRFRAVVADQGGIYNAEFRLKRRDGGAVDSLISARVIRQAEGVELYETVVTDISRLREAEEQRRKLQAELDLARKLEMIGQLASGIAHEINTPIQFIGDNAHFLKRAVERLVALVKQRGDPTVRPVMQPADLAVLLKDMQEAFDGSFEGINRVAEIVSAMKEFAHPGDTEKTATDLNHAIQTTLVVARNEYKHAADIVLELGEIPSVDCRRGEINKVLLNLIVNAAHAIESATNRARRGTITIATGHDATHVQITITDTGCGIAPAVISRIFDPFFTTKPVGKGTGQGLAIARSIVASHGGELLVASTVGVGTTFRVRLPLPQAAERGSAASPDNELQAAIG